MARRAYARGDRAWGRCARTGERVLLKDLVRDGQTGLLVTREAYEPKHPQEKPPRNIFDPQTLRRPAPDNDVTGAFTTAMFTWDPGSIADGVTEIKTATVEGALPGATVIVYPGVDLGGMIHSGYVSAPGQVSVLLVNLTGSPVDLGSSTWQVLVTSEIHSPGDTLYVASFAWDPSNVVDGAITTKDVTVTGAAVGDAVLVYPAQPLHGAMIFGYVSAADTVTVVLINFSGGSIEIENPAWPRWRVAVLPESSGVTCIPIAASDDDANEVLSSGIVSTTGTTIGLQTDRQGGFRFDGVALAQGATAPETRIQFTCAVTAASAGTTACTVAITGDDSDDAAAFTTGASDISARTPTTATATWTLPESSGDDAWVAGDSGANQLSPDLSGIVQEIIDRSGWATSGAMAFLLEQTDGGLGARVVAAKDNATYPPPYLRLGAVASGAFFQQDSLHTALYWDPGSVADGATDTVTATVTGAAVGDAVIVYPGVDLQGLLFCGYVNAADTVTVVLYNLTGAAVDLDAAAWAVRVLER